MRAWHRIPLACGRWARLLTLLAALVLPALAASSAREESVYIFGNRRVAFAVPEGFTFVVERNDAGVVGVRIENPASAGATLQISFVPDRDGELATARGRKEFMYAHFQSYLIASVDKVMQFEELAPRTGGGTYAVFTDASLVGKNPPPGEYVLCTAGVKAWSGVGAVFTLLSHAVDSPSHRALLALLRDSAWEKPVPLR
jgi:hypothetical protein